MSQRVQSNDVYEQEFNKMMGHLTEDELVERISACQDVVDKLEGDPVWQTVLRDAQVWVTKLDNTWQEIYDQQKLDSLRVLKLAYRHIVELPNKYKTDLEVSKQRLDAMRSTETNIERDYDAETNLEVKQ